MHFHVGWLDGVYSHRLGGDVTWHEDEGVTDADVAALVRRIAVHVKQALKKAGKWWGEGDAADAGDDLDGERQLLLELASGAVSVQPPRKAREHQRGPTSPAVTHYRPIVPSSAFEVFSPSELSIVRQTD